MVKKAMDKYGWTFPALLDTRSDVSEKYGVTGHPEAFLIDRKGDIAAMAIGPRDWSSKQAQELIDWLLAKN